MLLFVNHNLCKNYTAIKFIILKIINFTELLNLFEFFNYNNSELLNIGTADVATAIPLNLPPIS